MRLAAPTLVTLLVLGVGSADAQWLTHPTPGIPRTKDGKPNLSAPAPRTSEGKPDFSGVWGLDAGPALFYIAGELKPGEASPAVAKLLQEREENIQFDDQIVQLGESKL